jgi:pilus assembly protein CpaC
MKALVKTLTLRAMATVFVLSAASLLAETGMQELRMTVGKSLVLDYPADVGRISTSNPEVVDAVAVTTREILLNGKGQGAVTLIIWSRAGDRTFYNIIVEQNLEPLRHLLKETFPNENISIQCSKDSLSLTGDVSSPAVAERASALASTMAKTVVNNLRVAAAPTEKQIMLRVKFAELNRSLADSLGMNLLSTGATNTIGRTTTGMFSPPSMQATLKSTTPTAGTGATSDWTLGDMLNIFAFRPDLDLGIFIKALKEQRILQILAEPNIVTSDGKEASFHVGGEFPVPVLQGGANAGAVTIQFREFGIKLLFTPQSTANGTIRMHVRPEVSTIDYSNAVTLSGFVIPALSTRKMETNIELALGQSFVIAGLIDDRVSNDAMKVPGLGNVPILGLFFKSRQENKQKTELLVMVTPELAHVVAPGEKVLPDYPLTWMPVKKPAEPKPAEKKVEKTEVPNQDSKKPGWNPLRAITSKFGKGDDE